MEPLVNELLSAGYSVQLRHNAKETSWEDLVEHGAVALFDSEGKLLVRREGFQHNRKLRSGGAWDGTAVREIVEQMSKAIPAAA